MTDLYKISGKVVKIDSNTLSVDSNGNIETIRATNNEAIAGTDTNKALTPASGMALVTNQIDERMTNAMIYRGTWAITPSTIDYSGLNSYRPIKAGDFFRITGTGPATIDGIEYNPNDTIIFNQNCSATTTITTAMIDHNDHTDSSDTVYEAATQTLTNKTINASNNTITNLTLSNMASGVVNTSPAATPTDSSILTEKAVVELVDESTPDVDNTTINLNSSDELEVKDQGISIEKMNSSALSLNTSELQADATLPSLAKVNALIAAATPDVDNTTINLNSSDELQAIGVIEKNASAVKYDWIGTLAEYNAGIANNTIQSNWICYITDDSLSSVTYAGEIVQVSKTFSTAGNHVEFTEKCDTKSFITVFQDRIYVYPSEYTLDSDKMGITFTQNIEQGSVVDVNYFRGIPEEKIDDLIDAADTVNPDNYVTTGTSQTVTGSKTFTGTMNVPTSSDDVATSTQAVNVKYLYDNGYSDARLSHSGANKSLTNSSYTTNRILEIPQDIKLELNNGTLTLKAGSKVYVPNGFEADGTTPKFDVVTIDTDKTATDSAQRTLIIGISTNGDIQFALEGETGSPAVSTYKYYYDSNANKCYVSTTGVYFQSTFPLCIATSGSNGFTSIDQVFNGFGYIGSTVFALPGVKGAIPNGRNEDGTCKATLTTLTSVKTQTFTSAAQRGWYLQINGASSGNSPVYSDTQPSQNYIRWFSQKNNQWYDTHSSPELNSETYILPLASFNTDSTGKITSFEPYTVDSVVNSNASNFSQAGRSYLSGLGMPSRYTNLTLLASGQTYTAPANGWFNAITSMSASGINVGLMAINITTGFYTGEQDDHAGYRVASFLLPVRKGDVMQFYYYGYTAMSYFRFYYAEGEN